MLWHIPIPFKKFIPFWGLSAKPYKTTWVKFSVSIRTELEQDSKPCIDMHTHAFFVCLKIQRANHSNSIHMTPHHFVIHMYPIHTYIHTYIHNKTKHDITYKCIYILYLYIQIISNTNPYYIAGSSFFPINIYISYIIYHISYIIYHHNHIYNMV